MHARVVHSGLFLKIEVEHRAGLGVRDIAVIDADGVAAAVRAARLDLGAPMLTEEVAEEIRRLRNGVLLLSIQYPIETGRAGTLRIHQVSISLGTVQRLERGRRFLGGQLSKEVCPTPS